MHAALAPGEDLKNTTRDTLRSISNVLDSTSSLDRENIFGLFSWTRKIVTRVSTDAIYGASKKPFRDPAVEAGFWAIEKDFAYLGLNILPGLIAPKGQRGRKTLFRAFREYYAQEGHRSGSRIVQSRYEVNRKYGVSIEDIAHFDLSLCVRLLVNTVPAIA